MDLKIIIRHLKSRLRDSSVHDDIQSEIRNLQSKIPHAFAERGPWLSPSVKREFIRSTSSTSSLGTMAF